MLYLSSDILFTGKYRNIDGRNEYRKAVNANLAC